MALFPWAPRWLGERWVSFSYVYSVDISFFTKEAGPRVYVRIRGEGDTLVPSTKDKRREEIGRSLASKDLAPGGVPHGTIL